MSSLGHVHRCFAPPGHTPRCSPGSTPPRSHFSAARRGPSSECDRAREGGQWSVCADTTHTSEAKFTSCGFPQGPGTAHLASTHRYPRPRRRPHPPADHLPAQLTPRPHATLRHSPGTARVSGTGTGVPLSIQQQGEKRGFQVTSVNGGSGRTEGSTSQGRCLPEGLSGHKCSRRRCPGRGLARQ